MLHFRLLAAALLVAAALAAQPAIEPLNAVRIDEKPGQSLPMDAVFTDASGAQKKLGDYFNRDRPVIVTLVYYECPMLCTLILNGLVESLKKIEMTPGREFDIVTISIDPNETAALAAGKRDVYFKLYGRPEAANGWFWHVGEEAQIRRVSDALGFQYEFDERTKEYAHQACIFVLTPDGRISRYLYGIDFSPRDVRLSLLEAGRDQIASTFEKIILFCYHYDPDSRGYSLAAWRLVRTTALFGLLVIGTGVAWFWRRERRGIKAPARIATDEQPTRTHSNQSM